MRNKYNYEYKETKLENLNRQILELHQLIKAECDLHKAFAKVGDLIHKYNTEVYVDTEKYDPYDPDHKNYRWNLPAILKYFIQSFGGCSSLGGCNSFDRDEGIKMCEEEISRLQAEREKLKEDKEEKKEKSNEYLSEDNRDALGSIRYFIEYELIPFYKKASELADILRKFELSQFDMNSNFFIKKVKEIFNTNLIEGKNISIDYEKIIEDREMEVDKLIDLENENTPES